VWSRHLRCPIYGPGCHQRPPCGAAQVQRKLKPWLYNSSRYQRERARQTPCQKSWVLVMECNSGRSSTWRESKIAACEKAHWNRNSALSTQQCGVSICQVVLSISLLRYVRGCLIPFLCQKNSGFWSIILYNEIKHHAKFSKKMVILYFESPKKSQ
jgi:hypothetical protein